MDSVTGVLSFLVLLTCAPWCIYSEERRLVNMTMVRKAPSLGAYCLDGSLPGYHLDRGFGAGAGNWLLQFEGGGWCNDIRSCSDRAKTRRGSTRYMNKLEVFSGILSNNASQNPDFYNWNRVKLRYCDGASFAGDTMFRNGTELLYFRGQRIWQAIVLDLFPRGLGQAKKALLSGCSAGGLATFLHCDNFTSYLPKNASVKCLSDAGFFLDVRNIALNYTMRHFFKDLVSLQGVEQNLDKNCTSSIPYPELCFFPQYALPYIITPFFILNSAYDVFQINHGLVPPSADPHGHWYHCKLNPAACNAIEMYTLQGFDLFENIRVVYGQQRLTFRPAIRTRTQVACRCHLILSRFRRYLLDTLKPFFFSTRRGGMFINSCFAHCQSESQDTWFSPDPPRVNNKTIAQAVGDWYFGRHITKEIDCAYPCDKTCHNLIG